MVAPRSVSRKAFQESAHERWNAVMNLLALSELADLTPIQRAAHLMLLESGPGTAPDQDCGRQPARQHADPRGKLGMPPQLMPGVSSRVQEAGGRTPSKGDERQMPVHGKEDVASPHPHFCP